MIGPDRPDRSLLEEYVIGLASICIPCGAQHQNPKSGTTSSRGRVEGCRDRCTIDLSGGTDVIGNRQKDQPAIPYRAWASADTRWECGYDDEAIVIILAKCSKHFGAYPPLSSTGAYASGNQGIGTNRPPAGHGCLSHSRLSCPSASCVCLRVHSQFWVLTQSHEMT
eukprot:5620927-Amphidinium_carterae.1